MRVKVTPSTDRAKFSERSPFTAQSSTAGARGGANVTLPIVPSPVTLRVSAVLALTRIDEERDLSRKQRFIKSNAELTPVSMSEIEGGTRSPWVA